MRYRPTNQADLQAHAGMLAILAEDLADVPVALLEQAIQRHATTSPYMPKAADLIRLARECDYSRVAKVERRGGSYVEDHVASLNANLKRDDIEWAVSEQGTPYLRDKPSWSANRTRELEAKAERDRQEWKRAQQQAGNL